MKQFLFAIGFLSAIGTTTSVANELSGPEIRETISGKRVFLATRFGVEFPLTYKPNGKVVGDGTATGLGKYLAPKETGRWWIKGDQMCQRFPTWYKGGTFCFKLEETQGDALIWKRSDGQSGKARIG